MLNEVDHSANRMAIMGKGEAGKSFGVVRMVVLYRDSQDIDKWHKQ